MAKEEKFTFLSADGKTTIHAVKWIPEDGKYEAILQITHGMIEFVERYRPFAEFLTENGFMVVGHDHLGHGDSVASKDDWGYFAENPSDTVIADMHALRTMIQKENPGVPYFMMGHSMGSYMLRKYLTIHNDDLRGNHYGNRLCAGQYDQTWNQRVQIPCKNFWLASQKQTGRIAVVWRTI